MSTKFHSGIKEIHEAKKPIAKAWELSFKYLNLDNKLLKVMEILSDHENLFFNRNPYHNHYHLAEVVWSTAYLAKKEDFGTEKYFETMVILLFGATFHDADHTGKTNKYNFDIEQISTGFFKNWWKNNSLFVENILTSLTPIQIEQTVVELILFTDFIEGHAKVNQDYLTKKDNETFGLKINRMKKIINEADFLVNCMPQYGYHKTSMLLKEAVRIVDEERRWYLLSDMIKKMSNNFFTSDASKELKVENAIKKFSVFLEANLDKANKTDVLQSMLLEKFKNNL